VTACVALLGGSFDPVHKGHVALAELFAKLLQPDQLRIVPAGQPWQKSTGLLASDADRIAMLELAFAQVAIDRVAIDRVTIDLQEIERKGPTYTIDTLRSVRAEIGPQAALVFLMGADQLQGLDTWREWRTLFELAHIGVAARPGYQLDDAALPPAVAEELARRRATPAQLRAAPAGLVCVVRTLAVDISATQIREALGSGSDANSFLAPEVLDYIQQHNLYKS
jgi:nicotinate-nucleotide adenylyltransferase